MPQISQGTDDAIITPAWILAGELEHQSFGLDRDGWSSRFGFPPPANQKDRIGVAGKIIRETG
jgi:hypothetical protein